MQRFGDVEAPAVVFDFNVDILGIFRDRDFACDGLAVFYHIGDGLLEDSVYLEFVSARQTVTVIDIRC